MMFPVKKKKNVFLWSLRVVLVLRINYLPYLQAYPDKITTLMLLEPLDHDVLIWMELIKWMSREN